MRIMGNLTLPGDKSISHRALMLAAISDGLCRVNNLAESHDVSTTVNCLRSLDIQIQNEGNSVVIRGVGFGNFKEPYAILDCGNSGTTLRLLMGLLAGSNITATLDGDASLRRRPIRRVTAPLERMGGDFNIISGSDGCPVVVHGRKLTGNVLRLDTPSAQVKTALLFAGLLAEGETAIEEPVQTRDHTERALSFLGVDIVKKGSVIHLRSQKMLPHFNFDVPPDPSSAAFPICAALLIPGSQIEIAGLLLNPGRIGFIDIFNSMGAIIKIDNQSNKQNEPVGDVIASFSPLEAIDVGAGFAPTYIDEAPILALAASQAGGKSIFRGLSELKIKESNRLFGISDIINKMGGAASIDGDDLIIEGPRKLRPYDGTCYNDHRLAMMIEIGNLISVSKMSYAYRDIVGISFNSFYETMEGAVA